MEPTNTPASIRARFAHSRLSWWPVLLFLPARLLFAFLAQGLTAAVFLLQGATDAWAAATARWPVYSTLTDLLCLLALAWLTRREGLGLIDLLGVRGRAALRQLAWAPAYLLAVAPAAGLAHLITRAFYGSELPPMITAVSLTPAAAAYSVIVWPVVWALAEELVYLGYLLPRLEALWGRTWAAALAVVAFWGLQHLAIPFIPDATYLVSRVLAACAATGGITLVYILWRRRLVAMIAAHYLFDLSTALLIALLPLLNA